MMGWAWRACHSDSMCRPVTDAHAYQVSWYRLTRPGLAREMEVTQLSSSYSGRKVKGRPHGTVETSATCVTQLASLMLNSAI